MSESQLRGVSAKFGRIIKNMVDSNYRFLNLARRGFFNWMPDEQYLIRMGKARLGYKMDLKHPKTFNEKIQWLKIHDRRSEYTMMVDKYLVKDYVGGVIGKKYIIPTIGVWDTARQIDFNKLPQKFVLKCNHNSGLGMCICRDKSRLNFDKVRKDIAKGLKEDIFYQSREWPYKNVRRCIIAEEYLEEEGKIVPEDYKVYCLNGKPEYIVIFHDRFVEDRKPSESVYNTKWEKQNISLDDHFAISDRYKDKPKCLNELLDICRKLSGGYPQMRLDFYIVKEQIYFGEITLHTASGFQPMIPKDMDRLMGEKLKIDVM